MNRTMNAVKPILYTIAAFVAGYGTQMILMGHDTTVVFSWSAIINGLVVCGAYHSNKLTERS